MDLTPILQPAWALGALLAMFWYARWKYDVSRTLRELEEAERNLARLKSTRVTVWPEAWPGTEGAQFGGTGGATAVHNRHKQSEDQRRM